MARLALLAAAASAVSAHFGLTYPAWRADTLANEDTSKYSQWTYPCAGVDYKGSNRSTDWPLDGGALKLELHHPWTYIFVNLGLGANTTNFNVSLTPEFWNSTGKGTLCVDKLAVPPEANVQDGAVGTLQVVTVGESGSALYNCADIRFKKDAKPLSNCSSSTGVSARPVKEQTGNGTAASNSTAAKGDTKSIGAGIAGSVVGVLTAAGLATAFAMGL